MACFWSIGTNECTLVIASKYFTLILVRLNCTVEEDNRDSCCACLVNDRLGNIYRTGSNDVNDQQVCALADCGIDLLILCSLVAVAIIILIRDTSIA